MGRKVYAWGLGLVLAAFLVWRWTVAAEERGALKLEVAQNKAHVAALDSALKVERGKFQRDTVTLFRRIDHTVSRIDSVLHTDTIRLSLTDTVKVQVSVLTEADSTIKACRVTIRECGELRQLEQRRGDSLQARVRLMERQKPSLLSRCGLSAGYGVSDKGFGPSLLIGCRLMP